MRLKQKEELLHSLSRVDKENIAKIEHHREETAQTDATISFMDYGAGGPDFSLSDDEMYEGRRVSRKIKDIALQGIKYDHALYLYALVKEKQPDKILELGTCAGYSAALMSLAAPDSKIITIEGADEIADFARQNITSLELNNIEVVTGRFQDALPELLEIHAPFDFVFIDGHHYGNATVNYFKTILPACEKDAVIVFDDINWSESMKSAWEKIQTHESVTEVLDLDKIGLIVVKS